MKDFGLFAMSDSDFAGHLHSRRSTAGYGLFCLGALLAWSSKLMTTIAASTMEAEYMAAFHCSQEIVFIRNLLKEIGIVLTGPTIMYMDAEAAICAINSEKFHPRTKHIDVKYRLINQLCDPSNPLSPIKVMNIRSVNMISDLFTKVTGYAVYDSLIDDIISREKPDECT